MMLAVVSRWVFFMRTFLLSIVFLFLASCNQGANVHYAFLVVKTQMADPTQQQLMLIDSQGASYQTTANIAVANEAWLSVSELKYVAQLAAEPVEVMSAELVTKQLALRTRLTRKNYVSGLSTCPAEAKVAYYALNFNPATRSYQATLLHHQGNFTATNQSAVSDAMMAWLQPLAIRSGLDTRIDWCQSGSRF